MKAKTYQSDNNFTAPQSISTFGISIRLRGDLKHLGLEEFKQGVIKNSAINPVRA